QVNESGWPWTLLDESADPARVRPGAVLVAGDPSDPVWVRVGGWYRWRRSRRCGSSYWNRPERLATRPTRSPFSSSGGVTATGLSVHVADVFSGDRGSA